MNEDIDFRKFQDTLIKNELIGYSPSKVKFLWNTAKHCYKTLGIPMGVATGLATAGAGSVAIPGVGAVPGWVAGFLAGAVSGTTMCTIAKAPLKPMIDSIIPKDLD